MKYLFLLLPCFIFSQSKFNIEYLEKNSGGSYYAGLLFANETESVYTKKDTTGVVTPKETADDGFIITDAADGMTEEVYMAFPLSYEPIDYFNKKQNYFTFTTQKLYEKGLVIIRDSLPNIKWEITGDTKDILGFKCQKAIGTYKCREYAAWFTKDIPLSIGPWHLNGLPGAILEAKATDGYVEFTAIKATQVKDNSAAIKSRKKNLDKIGETISFSAYLDKLDEASIALSKDLINSMGEKELKGAKITSITSTTSFETHDLCRERKKKQVKKEF